jgi:hypothetical protein
MPGWTRVDELNKKPEGAQKIGEQLWKNARSPTPPSGAPGPTDLPVTIACEVRKPCCEKQADGTMKTVDTCCKLLDDDTMKQFSAKDKWVLLPTGSSPSEANCNTFTGRAMEICGVTWTFKKSEGEKKTKGQECVLPDCMLGKLPSKFDRFDFRGKKK